LVVAAAALLGCDAGAGAPGPMRYAWPREFGWRIENAGQTTASDRWLVRHAETRLLRVADRGGTWVAGFDRVFKARQEPGDSMRAVPLLTEDTLDFHLEIGPQGELSPATPGCDPVVPACADALPSAIRVELRRLVPRLSVWPVPRGGSWVDTLRFDDAARSRGSRGQVVTRYTTVADTVIDEDAYWTITWQALRTSFRLARGRDTLRADAVEEVGLTMVDKQRLVPVFATWAGALAVSPELRELGATSTAYRGRAYLIGSRFDPARPR
jgi:hypothetical protein